MNIHKITRYLLMLCAFTFLTLTAKGQDGEPLRLAVAGVSHGHLWEVISRLDRGDFKIVGVAEKDDYLREHNGLRDKLDPNLFYADLGEMLDKTHPEAVIVYEPIHDHLRVVEACAPRGIHVMVEKPLAVNNEHATRMASLAREKNILLLTNYETRGIIPTMRHSALSTAVLSGRSIVSTYTTGIKVPSRSTAEKSSRTG